MVRSHFGSSNLCSSTPALSQSLDQLCWSIRWLTSHRHNLQIRARQKTAMCGCGIGFDDKACICIFLSMMNYGLMTFGIVEKLRWTPFHQPMKCEASEPSAMRMLGKISAPSPLAEQLGMVPGNPPFGAYFNMTSSLACRNPNQIEITMKAQGSNVSMYAPNLTDLAVGGEGLPEALTGYGHIVSDVHLSAGGGTADMTQLTQVRFPLSAMLEMMAVASVQGYSPAYVKSVTPMRSCVIT